MLYNNISNLLSCQSILFAKKTTGLQQVTEKLYHIKYLTPPSGHGRMVVVFTNVQSMPITTDVVSSNLDQSEVYNIM